MSHRLLKCNCDPARSVSSLSFQQRMNSGKVCFMAHTYCAPRVSGVGNRAVKVTKEALGSRCVLSHSGAVMLHTYVQPYSTQKRAKTCAKWSKSEHLRAAKACLDALLGNCLVLLALIRNFLWF